MTKPRAGTFKIRERSFFAGQEKAILRELRKAAAVARGVVKPAAKRVVKRRVAPVRKPTPVARKVAAHR